MCLIEADTIHRESYYYKTTYLQSLLHKTGRPTNQSVVYVNRKTRWLPLFKAWTSRSETKVLFNVQERNITRSLSNLWWTRVELGLRNINSQLLVSILVLPIRYYGLVNGTLPPSWLLWKETNVCLCSCPGNSNVWRLARSG